MSKETDKQKLYRAAKNGDIRHSFDWFVRWRFPLHVRIAYYIGALSLSGSVDTDAFVKFKKVKLLIKLRCWHPYTWGLLLFAIPFSMFTNETVMELWTALVNETYEYEEVPLSVLANDKDEARHE